MPPPPIRSATSEKIGSEWSRPRNGWLTWMFFCPDFMRIFVLGDLEQGAVQEMTADYEAEQERLKLEIEVTEEWLETQETMSADVDAFVALTQKYVDVPELTPTIVNEYIKED